MECSICLEQIKKKKKLDCKHIICSICYKKLIEFDLLSCPVCRHPIDVVKPNVVKKEIKRNRRRNLSFSEYEKRKIIIKNKYRFRKDKKNKSFYKRNSILFD